jgi:hypothetical protein
MNDPAAALRVAVDRAIAEYTAEQIRAMVEAQLRARGLRLVSG